MGKIIGEGHYSCNGHARLKRAEMMIWKTWSISCGARDKGQISVFY